MEHEDELAEAAEGRKGRPRSRVAVEMGARIRATRERRGLSQAAVSQQLAAQDVAIHQTGLARLEQGARPLNVDELFALAAVLGVEPGTLLLGDRQDPMRELKLGVAAGVRRIQDAIADVVYFADRHNERVDYVHRLIAEHVDDEVRAGKLPDDDDARARRRESLGDGALTRVHLSWRPLDDEPDA